MQPERTEVFREGLIAGIIGHVTVAVLFAIVNLFLGRSPFHTAALLGSALFYGLDDASQLVIAPGPILAYNGAHLVIFLALGILAAWLAFLSERGPELWYVGAVVYLFITFHTLGFFLVLTAGVREAVGAWTMVASGALASGAMAAYLIWARPKFREELLHFRTE